MGKMWTELQRVGIPGMLICQWGIPYTTSGGLQAPAQWTKGISTSFRLSDDIQSGWSSMFRIYNQVIYVAKSGLVGPGHIADADMLTVGDPRMTFDEQATHFAAWAMFKSSLMISTNIPSLSNELVGVLQNRDLIAINQDSAVKPINLVQRWTNDRDLWAGDLANGDVAVLIVDTSNTRRTLSLDLSALGISSATVKDLWSGQTTNNVASFSKQVNAHGSAPLRLSNIKRSSAAQPKYTYTTASVGSLSNGARVEGCSGCSSSNKVTYIGGSSNGRLVLSNIRTSKATQTVRIDYVNGEIGYMGGTNERVASISVNGGAAKTVSFPLSGYNWDKDVFRDYAVELSGFSTTGTNTITISGVGSAYAPDIARVGVIA
jgi:alpha-galactosidase